jgi:atlastin
MRGRPIQIIISRDDHSFKLDDALVFVLQDHIRDKNIIVVSVAEDFRKGKSFLLTFFLQYLVKQLPLHTV